MENNLQQNDQGMAGDAPGEGHAPGAGSYTEGVGDAVPVILGYIAIGLAFGVVAGTAGITVPEIALMSLILYAGSAQFVTVGLIAAGMPAGAIIATIFLVNVRHLLYSAAISPHVRGLPAWQNALIGAELTDETFAVAATRLSRGLPAGAGWLFGVNNASHAAWVLCTVLGALLGSAITDTRAFGLDFALASMFAALLVLQIVHCPDLRPAVMAAAASGIIAVGGTLLLPASWAVIAATLIAATVGMVMDGRKRQA